MKLDLSILLVGWLASFVDAACNTYGGYDFHDLAAWKSVTVVLRSGGFLEKTNRYKCLSNDTLYVKLDLLSYQRIFTFKFYNTFVGKVFVGLSANIHDNKICVLNNNNNNGACNGAIGRYIYMYPEQGTLFCGIKIDGMYFHKEDFAIYNEVPSAMSHTMTRYNTLDQKWATFITGKDSSFSYKVGSASVWNYTLVDHSPMSWFSLKLKCTVLIMEYVIQTNFQINCTFPASYISYRLRNDRDFTLYNEDDGVKVFPKELQDYWAIKTLKRPFLASEVRFHLQYQLPEANGIAFSLNVRGLSSILHSHNFHYLSAVEVDVNNITANEIAIQLEDLSLITGFQIIQQETFERFCIKYGNGENLIEYKDNPLSAAPTMFLRHGEVVSVRPFYASLLVISCVELREGYINPHAVIYIKGTKKNLPEHKWSRSTHNLDHPDGLYVYEDQQADMTLYGNVENFQKVSPDQRVQSDFVGADCYTRPDFCDNGFTLAFDIDSKLHSTTSYYKLFAQQGHVISMSSIFCIVFSGVTLGSYVNFTNSILFLNNIKIQGTTKFYIANAYSTINTITEDRLNALPSFSVNLQENNTIHLTDVMNKLVKNVYGFIKLIHLFIKVSGQYGTTDFDFENIFLDLHFRVKVPVSIRSLNYTNGAISNHYKLPELKVVTGFKLKSCRKAKKESKLVHLHFKDTSKTWQEYPDANKLELENEGDVKYLQLIQPLVFVEFYITLQSPDGNLCSPLAFELYGADIDDDNDDVFPILSFGLHANKKNRLGLGLCLFYDVNSDLFAVVQTKHKHFSVKTSFVKSSSSFVLTWSKGEYLELYVDGILVHKDMGKTSLQSHDAYPRQEYLSIFGNYHSSFSYSNVLLSNIKFWRKHQTSDQIQKIFSITGQPHFPESSWQRLSAGSLCNCVQLLCPCETKDYLLSMKYKSISYRTEVVQNQGIVDVMKEPKYIAFPFTSVVVEFEIKLNFRTVNIKQIFLHMGFENLRFKLSNCFFIDMNKYRGQPIKWCGLSHRERFRSPDLISIFRPSITGKDNEIMNIGFILYHVIHILPIKFATLEILYEPPAQDSFVWIPAYYSEQDSLYIYGEKSTSCISFSYKTKGDGFAHLSVYGSERNNKAITKEILRFYLNDMKSTWQLVSVPGVSEVKLSPLRNGNNVGYIGFKDIEISKRRCNLHPPMKTNSSTNDYNVMKETLEALHFPIPILVIPCEFSNEVISPLSITVTDGVKDRRINHSNYMYPYQPFLTAPQYKIWQAIPLSSVIIAFWIKHVEMEVFCSVRFKDDTTFFEMESGNGKISIASDFFSSEILMENVDYNEWKFYIVEFNNKTGTFRITIDFKEIKSINEVILPSMNFDLVNVSLGSNLLCFQWYDEPLEVVELEQSRWCPNRHSIDACAGSRSCATCDQFTGKWNIWNSLAQLMSENCTHSFEKFAVTTHFSMDLVERGSLFNLRNSNQFISFDESVMELTADAIVNNALCVRNASSLVLLESIAECTINKCFIALWLNVHCEYNRKKILLTPAFSLSCVTNLTDGTMSIVSTYQGCTYKTAAKAGLWYHLSLSVVDGVIKIYVDGVERIPVKICTSDLITSFSLGLEIGESESYICIDELMISLIPLNDVDVKDLFETSLTGNGESIDIVKSVIPAYRFNMEVLFGSFENPNNNNIAVTSSERIINEVITSMNGTAEFVDVKDLFEYTDSGRPLLTGLFEFYITYFDDDILNKVLGLVNKEDLIRIVRLYDDLCDGTKPNPGAYCDAINLSNMATYEVKTRDETSVVLKWILKTFIKKQPVNSLQVFVKFSNGSIHSIQESENTDYILISNLHVHSNYSICIFPQLFHGTPNMTCDTWYKIQTAEGVPTSAPIFHSFDAIASDEKFFINCTFEPIPLSAWHGVPFGYQIYWKETKNLTSLEENENYQQWNLQNFSSMNIEYEEGTQHYEALLETFMSYENYTIIIQAATQNGTAHGVRNMNSTRSIQDAPEIAPLISNATIIMNTFKLSWLPIPATTELWNMDDLSKASYIIVINEISSDNDTVTSKKNNVTLTTNVTEISVDLKLFNGQHFYKISIAGYSEYGEGPPSDSVCFMPATEPSTELTFSVVSINSNDVSLLVQVTSPILWQGKNKYFHVKIEDDISNEVLRFNKSFEYDENNDDIYFQNVHACNNTILSFYFNQNTSVPMTIVGLECFRTYDIKLLPCNEINCHHNKSNSFTTRTKECPPSCAPEILSVHNTSSTSVLVTWNNISLSCVNGILSQYIVTLIRKQSLLENVTVSAGKNVSVEFHELERFEEVCVVIAGSNSNGTGPWSNETCALTDEDKPSAIPEISSITMTKSTCNFSVIPTEHEQLMVNGRLRGIILRLTKKGNSNVRKISYYINHTKFFVEKITHYFVIRNLSIYTEYAFSLEYFTRVGSGNASQVFTAKTLEGVPNSSPESLVVTALQSRAVNISWTEFPPLNWQGRPFHYKYNVTQYLRNLTVYYQQSNVSYNATTYQIVHLYPDTNTTLRLAACTREGCGEYTEISFATSDDVPSGSPTFLDRAINSTSIHVTWSEVALMERNAFMLNYTLTLTDETNKSQIAHTSERKISFFNLFKYHNYTLTLQAVNTKGFGPKQSISLQTEQDVPVGSPTNVSHKGGKSTTIMLFWKEIPATKRNGIVIGYSIFYSEVLSNTSWGVTKIQNVSTTTPYELSGLKRDTRYNISIAGYTAKGLGPKCLSIIGSPGAYVNGNWSAWSMWSFCSATCGGGISVRTRACTNPSPENGGSNCTGTHEEQSSCNEDFCSGYMLAPPGQIDCSAYCETVGAHCSPIVQTSNSTDIYQKLGVNCSSNEMQKYWTKAFHPGYHPKDNICVGYFHTPLLRPCKLEGVQIDTSFQRICNCLQKNDVGFSEWAQWSVCSSTCGNSRKYRKRICYETCSGLPTHTVECDVPNCPIDGVWGSWSSLSGCSVTCGYGYRAKTRICDKPTTQFNGKYCPGHDSFVIPGCNPEPCPVHGGVSDWSEWEHCEQPCGVSITTRRRYCNNPVPANRGQPCSESLEEKRSCYLFACEAISMTYTFHFTDEKWNYKLVYSNHALTQNLQRKVIENVFKLHENTSIIMNAHVDAFRHGSVVAHVTVLYNYINREQIVNIADQLEVTQKVYQMPISSYAINSTSIICPPPTDIVMVTLNNRAINVTFNTPTCHDLTRPILTYVFYRVEADVSNASSKWLVKGVSNNQSWILLTDLIPATTYRGYALQGASIGNGVPSRPFRITSPEIAPTASPLDFIGHSTSPEKIYLEWENIPAEFRNGLLLHYVVRYKRYFDNKTLHKYIQYGQTSTTLGGLVPYTLYWFEIKGVNSAGEGPSDYVILETLEGVPSLPVPDVVVHDMVAINWWAVAWGPIPEDGLNGILLGYRLTYYMSYKSDVEIGTGKSVTSLEFDTHTFYYQAKNLESFATYNVSIAGFTAPGDGPAPQFFAKTCRCLQHLYANWIVSPPYTKLVGNDYLTGIFTELVEELVIEACGSCQSYKKSVLHFFQSKTGENPQKHDEYRLKKSISEEVDVIFPVYGQVSRQMGPSNGVFLKLISSPGCSMIVRDEAKIAGTVEKIIISVVRVWPFLLVSYLIAAVFGCLVWACDQFENPEEFRIGNFLRGSLSGFWFAFVTMTTTGYGDITPRSFWGKSISIAWALIGVVLNGIIIGFITTALTSVGVAKNVKLYDTRTAVLNNSFEYRYAVLRNAKIGRRYADVMSMLDALQSNEVDAVLVDTYTMTSHRHVIKEKLLLVKKLIYTNSGYGFVLSSPTLITLKQEIESGIQGKAAIISEFISELGKKVPKLDLPENGKTTKGVFSSKAPSFRLSVMYLEILTAIGLVLGICFEFWKYLKRRKQIAPDSSPESHLLLYKEMFDILKTMKGRIAEKCATLERKHLDEMVTLVRMKKNYEKKKIILGQRSVNLLVAKSFDKEAQAKIQ